MPRVPLILILIALAPLSLLPANVEAAGSPDFTLSLNPSMTNYQYGPGARTNWTLTSVNGFQGVVNMNYFWLNGSSDIFVGLVNPSLSAGGSFTDHITVVSPPISIGCCGILQVTATSGSLSHTANFIINVPPGPNFMVAVAPKSLIVPQGTLATANFTATNTDTFSGSVFFIWSVSPGILSTITLSTISVGLVPGASGSTLLAVNTTGVTPGIYNFTLTGYDLGHSHSDKLTLIVLPPSAGFTVTVGSSLITLHPGSSSAFTTNLTSIDNFFGNATLTVSPGSPDLTTNWTAQTLGLKANSTISTGITLTASNSMPPGTYSIVVSASCNGIIHHTTITILIPFPADFNIVIAPTQLTIRPGTSATATITLNGISNFNGTINLTTQQGAGPVTNLSVQTATLSYLTSTKTITLTVSLPSNAQPGNYTITINATNGITTHQASMTVDATPASGAQQPPFIVGLNLIYTIMGLVAAAAAASILAVLVIMRHRRITPD